MAMTSVISLLWPEGEAKQDPTPEAAVFHDLHLQEIFAAVCLPVPDFALVDWYHAFPGKSTVIRHRQAILRDLLQPSIRSAWTSFTQRMQTLRRQLEQAQKLYHDRQRQRVFLDAIGNYQTVFSSLVDALTAAKPRSTALCTVLEGLIHELQAPQRQEMHDTARALRQELDALRYDLQISGSHVSLWRECLQRNVDEEIVHTFSRFLAAPSGEENAREEQEIGQMDVDPVQARVLDAIAELFPELFARLAVFYQRWAQPDPQAAIDAVPALRMARYPFVFVPLLHWERELQFYLAFLDFLSPLEAAGLPSCVPELCEEEKRTHAESAYDLALAARLRQEQQENPVLNDIDLHGSERILLVSGPNQGGKTTYARCFGQLHYLAGIGLPVPAQQAQLFVCDAIYTHFERREDAESERSKLEADLLRLRHDLERATPRSIFVLNELFHSTTLDDARFLSQELLKRLRHLDPLVLWVSFLDELSRSGADVVSILSMVDSEEEDKRTFRLLRKPADGLAHALSLARKFGLDYPQLLARIAHASPSS
ncbi:DNA mismatch repair protein MutS [Acidithiobacillus sp. CV18-2]|nr:DNA mismatch repair protein MutS [Acidithiobacillus sp. CV18-3]MBU2776838.1 DNA mismatch repair protein MutS [Acidithiobacillus sp. CV18-2]MBU2799432.1 DNA mismatch repair protein MutS [Acidithiobacillus sp. VAN18-4]